MATQLPDVPFISSRILLYLLCSWASELYSSDNVVVPCWEAFEFCLVTDFSENFLRKDEDLKWHPESTVSSLLSLNAIKIIKCWLPLEPKSQYVTAVTRYVRNVLYTNYHSLLNRLKMDCLYYLIDNDSVCKTLTWYSQKNKFFWEM